jgi:CRP-like cAMP-binding protein
MRRPELKERLLENEIFAALDDEVLDELLRATEVEKFHPGQRILLEGEPSEHLFSLLSGVVGVFYSSPEGADVLVKIFSPPAVLGEMEIVYGQARQEYVEAFEK